MEDAFLGQKNLWNVSLKTILNSNRGEGGLVWVERVLKKVYIKKGSMMKWLSYVTFYDVSWVRIPMELKSPVVLDKTGLQLLFPFYFETVVIGWS